LPGLAPLPLPRLRSRIPLRFVAGCDRRHGERQTPDLDLDLGEGQALNALPRAIDGRAEDAGIVALDMQDQPQTSTRRRFDDTYPVAGRLLRGCRDGKRCGCERSRQRAHCPL
jgi:hypothetical protein